MPMSRPLTVQNHTGEPTKPYRYHCSALQYLLLDLVGKGVMSLMSVLLAWSQDNRREGRLIDSIREALQAATHIINLHTHS